MYQPLPARKMSHKQRRPRSEWPMSLQIWKLRYIPWDSRCGDTQHPHRMIIRSDVLIYIMDIYIYTYTYYTNIYTYILCRSHICVYNYLYIYYYYIFIFSKCWVRYYKAVGFTWEKVPNAKTWGISINKKIYCLYWDLYCQIHGNAIWWPPREHGEWLHFKTASWC